jgi:membrane associated rhomboid family serine protease
LTRPRISTDVPWVTLTLIILAIAISVIAPEPSARFDLMVLDRAQPRPWPLLMAHWLHTDPVHLGWNVFAFGCLGVLGEPEGRSRYLTAIAAGIVAVDIWFAWINVDLRFYCGLSGVLNTVLLVTLYGLRGRIAAHWLIAACVLVALKVGWEWHSGVALLTHSRWPSAVGAHVAGFVAALPLLAIYAWRDRRTSATRVVT